MIAWHVPLLLGAGFAAGLSASIAGLASVFSYPALLATGMAPLAANVTNTVALVFGSIGSVAGSRPELALRRRVTARMAVIGTVGGLAGGVLLLATPPGVFAKSVPILIGAASLIILGARRPAQPRRGSHDVVAMAGVFVIGVYGGYFGAAAGMLLLALLLASTSETFARCAAVKNIVLGLANLAAAVLFVLRSHVSWGAVVLLSLGLLVGGRIGPVVIRTAPERPLRIGVALLGLGLATFLAITSW